jgi:hypothetical protein
MSKSTTKKSKKPAIKGQKIGSIPPGFDENDNVYMEDSKIFIKK